MTFEAGSYITTVEVPIVDDSIGEVAETFYGTLTVVGSSPVQITEGRAEVLIIDDDSKQALAWIPHTPVHFGSMYSESMV